MIFNKNFQGVAVTVLGLSLNLLGSALRDSQKEFDFINVVTYIGIALILLGAYITFIQTKTYSEKFKASNYEPSTGTIIKVPYSKHKKKSPVAIIYKEIDTGEGIEYLIPELSGISIKIEENYISFHHPEPFDGLVIIK